MNLQEACEEVIRLSYIRKDLAIGEFEPGDTITPELRSLVNRGTRIVSRVLCPFDHDIGMTITAGTARYSMNDLTVVEKRVTKLYSAYALGKGSFFGPNRTSLSTWSLSQMDDNSQGGSWRDAVAGESTRIVDLGRGTGDILLWTTPSASYVASFASGTNQIRLAGEFL